MSKAPKQAAALAFALVAGTALAQMFAQGFPCAGPDPVACVRDVNTKGGNGYTLLATVLFNPNREIEAQGPEARRYPKLELVRRLLDAGASVNGDHGGWGRYGALGLARRGETEVIELLVARGATLAGPEGHGPVATAIEMDRDDLALALLRRDRDKMAPRDRSALPLAARRGWGRVVTALLEAGADPNAADAQGMTALMLAERRRDAAMAKSLAAAGAKAAAAPPRTGPGPGAGFAEAAATEIDEVAFFDPPRFALAAGQEGAFAFYGREFNRFEEVWCEPGAAFEFVVKANLAGGLHIGICTGEAKRVGELAVAAQPALDAVLEQIFQAGNKPDAAMLAKHGWTYAKRTGAGGAEEHFFAVLAIGHGVLSMPTLVLSPRGARRAIVVQADTMRLCENYGLDDQTPLCSDTRQALTDIARRIEARFPERP